MHLYDAIEEYNFTHGKHFDAATGQYDLLMPHDLGRPLTHEEMDYNFLYQKQTMNGFRIFGSGTNYKLNIDDIEKVLKFHKIQPSDEDYSKYIAAGYVDDQYIWIPVEMQAAAQPTYVTLVSNPATIGEISNNTVTYTLTTVNVEDGTTIDWSIATGSGITANDFVGGLTGTATINTNTATWTVQAAADHVTEGTESFTLTLASTDSASNDTTTMSQDANGNGGVALSATTSISDTSKTPQYNSISGAGSMAEGTSTFYTVNTSYFYQAATIGWEIDFTNSTATSADFTGATSGTVNMNSSGSGTIGVTIASDLINDNENFTIKLVGSDSNGIAGQDRSKLVTISNASFPTYSTFTGPATLTEGQTATYILSGSNILNGTQVGYVITGSSGFTKDDISLSSLTGYITMGSNNTGTLSFTALEDNTVESDETLIITLNTQDEDGNTTGLPMSAETVISDAAPGYTLTGPSSITEGNLSLGVPHISASYLFTASNMVPGTTVYWELRNYGSSSNDVDFAADFVTTRTGSGQVQTNGNVVELEFSLQIASDSLNESNENFKVIVWDASNNYDNTPPHNGAVSGALATKDVTIVSFNPVYQIVGDSTITEGQTKTYTFRASGHPAGETFWWELRNYGSNASDVDFAADFVTARTGSGPSSTVNGGFIEQDIIIEIANDMDTDPGENFKLVLWADSSSYDSVAPYNSVASGALATKDITILDLAPQYVIDTASSQAEPSTLVATLNTRYVAAGTAYTWEVEPTGANPVEAADFVGGVLPSGSGTISTYNSTLSASDTFDISVVADNTTEGTERYNIVVKVLTVQKAAKTIDVTDDSQTPAAQIHWLHWSSNAGYPSGSSLIVEPAGGWYLNNNTTTSDFDLIWADMVANQGTANNPDAIESYAASGGLTQSSIPNGTIGFNAIGAGNRYYIAIPQSMSGDPSSTALFQLPDSANANIVFSGRMAFNISSVAYWLYDVGLSLSPDALNLNLKNA